MSQFVIDTTRPLQRVDTSRNRLVMLAIIVIGLVFGVAGQTVLATSHNDPVNGCYDTNSGVLRHIGSGTCRNNEVALSWPSMNDFTTLQAALLTEQQARASADTALQTQIADLRLALDTEIAARQSVADDLASLQTEVGTLHGALTAETNARVALQQALEGEITALQEQDAQILSDAIAHADDKYLEAEGLIKTETAARKSSQMILIGALKNIIESLIPLIDSVLSLFGTDVEEVVQMLENLILFLLNLNGSIDGSIDDQKQAIE